VAFPVNEDSTRSSVRESSVLIRVALQAGATDRPEIHIARKGSAWRILISSWLGKPTG
jgi:hypothetical protein